MPFLKSLVVSPPRPGDAEDHSDRIPAIADLADSGRTLRLDPRVTFFVGDNGSGKSTLLEAMAVRLGFNAEGGSTGMQFATRGDSISLLHRRLTVSRTHRREEDSYFLRAESYFNVATTVEQTEMSHWYGGSPHERSHGESFIDLAVHRFSDRGLYLLDEPEAALSIHGQLQFLVRMHDLVEAGSQFVIATHSPILTGYPGATILEFGDTIAAVSWDEIDSVAITADFLGDRDAFVSELLADDP